MAEEKLGRGGYLTFESSSNGAMFLVWSETPVEGAWAFFSPGKTVPKFKFKSNGGRSEIQRQCGGVNKANLASGWCQYIKVARQFEGKLVILNTDIGVWLNLNTSNKVKRVKPNEWTSLSQARAVSVAGSNYAGYGDGNTLTMTKETFTQAVGSEGFYIGF